MVPGGLRWQSERGCCSLPSYITSSLHWPHQPSRLAPTVNVNVRGHGKISSILKAVCLNCVYVNFCKFTTQLEHHRSNWKIKIALFARQLREFEFRQQSRQVKLNFGFCFKGRNFGFLGQGCCSISSMLFWLRFSILKPNFKWGVSWFICVSLSHEANKYESFKKYHSESMQVDNFLIISGFLRAKSSEKHPIMDTRQISRVPRWCCFCFFYSGTRSVFGFAATK